MDAEPIAPEFLRAEQRDVRSAQQRRRVAAVIRIGRHATAHADGHLAPIDQQRPLEASDQALGAPLDLGSVARVWEHQRELVAAEPGDETVVAGDQAQPLADLGEHAIAEVVAERVVDGLEVVEIEEQHGNVRSGGSRGASRVEHLVQALEQLAAVRQVGERVVIGEVPQLQRPLLDALLELRLVGLDRALCVREFRRHLVERVRELVDFAGATAGDASGEIAGGKAARAGRQAAHGPGDRPGSREQREQREHDRLVGRCLDRIFRVAHGLSRAGDRGSEFAPCGCFDVLAYVCGERLTVRDERSLPLLDVRAELECAAAQLDRGAEVLHQHRQPMAAGGGHQLRAMRFDRPP